MNRLELAAQAPPIPDWYKDNYKAEVMSYEEFFETIRPDLVLNSNYTKDYYSYRKTEEEKQIEFDWRFYWADEMIKRNETNE
jgi:hypothetical protein